MRHERQPPHEYELDLTLVEKYTDAFVPRLDRYPLQLENGRWVQVKRPLTTELVQAHLENYRSPALDPVTLGAYALDPESQATWLCMDADDEAEWTGLRRLANKLYQTGIPAYIEPSRRGGHLWLFTPRLPGNKIRRFGKQLLLSASLDSVELYPKQDYLGSGPGSLVRLPLGLHRKSKHIYPFVDLQGQPLAPTITQQIRLLGDPERVPLAFIEQVSEKTSTTSTPVSHTSISPDRQAPGDLPSERIKNAVSVYDFVRQYVALDPSGRGHCPFHDDEHMSFQVNQKQNYWHCYAGCGGGSIIDFWARWREFSGQSPDFVATITDLAQRLL